MKPSIIGILPALVTCFLIGCGQCPQETDLAANQQAADPSLKSRKTYSGSLEPLETYRGKELANLDAAQASELLATIKKLIPEREYNDVFDFQPWHVWEFPNKGQPALVLFEVNNSGPHPGSTGVRVNVFDRIWNTRSESEFWTGHRCYLQTVSLEKQADDEDPLIVLATGLGAGPGPDVRKQVYARIGDRFDLIRLEASDGKATRNDYYVNHFACGPRLPKQTEDEWETDVLCGNRLRLLRALVWLGGIHWEGKLPDASGKQFEPSEQIQLVRTVRAKSKVADKLKLLRNSGDRWVREAATLAADPQDTRW